MIEDPIPLRHPKFVVREHHLGTKYSDLAEPDGPNGLVLGDSLAVLSNMPEKSVQTVVTSPPYWSNSTSARYPRATSSITAATTRPASAQITWMP